MTAIQCSSVISGADLEHGAPVTATTRFHVASVSKQFTAFAVLLEAAANRVDLAADIHAYLPELADYGASVTVSDLVHHTGGLRDQWELMMLSGTPLDGIIRQSAIVAMAARQKELNFPPGTDFRYSNTGYSLLAEIVARTSGKPFARYLEEAVFAPLGMRESLVYGDASRLLPDRAMSYRFNARGELRLARLNYSNYGATSLHTTARDLAKADGCAQSTQADNEGCGWTRSERGPTQQRACHCNAQGEWRETSRGVRAAVAGEARGSQPRSHER